MSIGTQKRFGWWSVGWAAWLGLFFALEMPAVHANKIGGDKDRMHRTLTENVRYLAATDVDGEQVKHWRTMRRVGLMSFLCWLVTHMVTNGRFD